jgi:hypothetical protein
MTNILYELLPIALRLELIWVVAAKASPELISRDEISEVGVETDLVSGDGIQKWANALVEKVE